MKTNMKILTFCVKTADFFFLVQDKNKKTNTNNTEKNRNILMRQFNKIISLLLICSNYQNKQMYSIMCQ